MPTKQKHQPKDAETKRTLNGISKKIRAKIEPDEWRFAFYPFQDDEEIVGCFMWEYLREHPSLETMNRTRFVYDLLQSYWGFKARRDLNVFYKGIPFKIISSLLNNEGKLPAWLSLSENEKNAIFKTPIRPARIPVELEEDEIYRWSYKPPKAGSVHGSESDYAYWNSISELSEEKDKPNASKKSASSRSQKTDADAEIATCGAIAKKLRGRDILISFLRIDGVFVQPDFLVNFLDYGPEEIKRALGDWVDQKYPKYFRIGEKRGAFKIKGIKAHLKRLAVMRLMNKMSVQTLQANDLRRFDESTDRDFYSDRIQAGVIFSKYFALEGGQEPRCWKHK